MRVHSSKAKLSFALAVCFAFANSFQCRHAHGEAASFVNFVPLTAGRKQSHNLPARIRRCQRLQAGALAKAYGPIESEHEDIVDKLSEVFASSSLEITRLQASLEAKDKDIEHLRTEHQEYINQLNKELNDRINALSTAHEQQMSKLKTDFERQLQTKEENIKTLTAELEQTKGAGQERLINLFVWILTEAIRDAKDDEVSGTLAQDRKGLRELLEKAEGMYNRVVRRRLSED